MAKIQNNLLVIQQQGGLDINGVVESYKVYAGNNVSAGDFVTFVTKYQTQIIANATAIVAQCYAYQLSSTKALIVGGYEGMFFVVDFTSTITVGAALAVYRSNPRAVAVLSDKKVVVGCYGSLRVLNIDSNTLSISLGIYLDISTDYRPVSLLALSDSLVYGVYESSRGGDITLHDRLFSVTNEAITQEYGASTLSSSLGMAGYFPLKKSETTILVPLNDSLYIKSVENNVISTVRSLVVENISYYQFVSLTYDTYLLVYKHPTSGNIFANIYTITDTSITLISSTDLSFKTTYFSVTALSATKAIICYRETTDNMFKAATLIIGASSVSMGVPITISEYTTSMFSGPAIYATGDSSINVYYSTSEASTQIAFSTIVLNANNTLSITPSGTNETFVKKTTSSLLIAGIANEAGAAGDTIGITVP